MGQNATSIASRSSDASGIGRAPRRGFALLSPDFLDELRSRVTLSALVSRTVPLKKAGNEFKACCPFHQERTPSFWVNDQKGFYHCFGCGAHGDAIRWLTDARGVAFIDAVRELADQVGMELPKPSVEQQARQEQAFSLQQVTEAAARYFETSLGSIEGDDARQYLRLRDIGHSAVSEFRIGFAPNSRTAIVRALKEFTQEQLVEAGLLISVDSKPPYARFRNRVMVPIRDPRGRTIAFGGRILGEGEPKYLNSPDTPLFDKGRVLFNLDKAAPASRQAERIVVVEGYFDVISLSQAGLRECVAPMGTALTEAQLEQLWRLVDAPILCFDGDAAGQKAALRACERAMPSLRSGKHLRIALLPAGQDPDDFVRQRGRDALEDVLGRALPLATFLYRSELAKIDQARPEQRAELRKHLDDLARSCADRFVADEFARSFKDLFFEDFGWKRKQSDVVFRSTVRTSPRVAPDLARLFVRSALYGLTRYPSVAAENLENLANIPIAHPDLQRWRDAIGETVIINPDPGDGMHQILERFVLPQTLQRDIRTDLRFGFVQQGTAAEVATRQLSTLVAFLATEHALRDEIDELDRGAVSAIADGQCDAYVSIEARRQVLREARLELFTRGASWDDEIA